MSATMPSAQLTLRWTEASRRVGGALGLAEALRVVLVFALLAGPAAAQYQMQVEPAQVAVGVGQAQPLRIKYNAGQGWKDATADEWHTLVQPAEAAKVEVVGGQLRVVGLVAGAAKLHVWHKTQLSWMGLYVVLPVEVKAAAPVPVPPVPVPPVTGPPSGRVMLRLYRIDRLEPESLPTDRAIAVAPGETIRLALYAMAGFSGKQPVVPVVNDASRACRCDHVHGHRFALVFPETLPEGQLVQVSIGDKNTGLSHVYQFTVQRRAAVRMVAIWYKLGLDTEWELLAGEILPLRPGQIAFLKVFGRTREGGSEPVDVTMRLVGGAGSQLHSVGPQQWLLIAGFGNAQPGQVDVMLPGARERQVAFEIVR